MKSSYTQSLRQTGTLSYTMVQAVKVMRMTAVELQEHLADTIERNPFVELEREQRHSGAASHTVTTPDVPDNGHVSLYKHLADQFPLLFDTNRDIEIAVAFLEEIEPSGWCPTPVERVAWANDFDQSECERVLSRLKTLEPIGVFARDLKECLRLQAIDRELLDDEMDLLITHLDLLMTCDAATLAQRLGTSPRGMALRLQQIRRLDPKPGSAFSFDETVLRGSDVILQVTEEDMTIELNRSSFPTVRLPLASQKQINGRSSDQTVINELIEDAKALQSAVEMRKTTTLAVVAAIFARQGEFLAQGYPALVPMRMKDIADDIGISEATVSRVLSGLTIQCPLGCIAAKSLFCSPVSHRNQTRTKYVVLQLIKDLIAGEDKSSPLSDHELARLIQKSGFEVSRRTVTKYRQSLDLNAPVVRRKAAELTVLSRESTCADKSDDARAMTRVRSSSHRRSEKAERGPAVG